MSSQWRVAQLAEQGTVNPWVAGSSPASPANGEWCNWQHDWFWSSSSGFESLLPNKAVDIIAPHGFVAELADAPGLGPGSTE